MSDDQNHEFVDRQYTRPRSFHGENQMIYIIDFKTQKIADENKKKKKKRKK